MYLPQSDQEGRGVDLKARHHATDCVCCGFFVVASLITLVLYFWALSHGVVARLYRGQDYGGHLCGVNFKVLNAPYLYWCPTSSGPEGLRLHLHRPICVSSCPGPDAVQPGLLAPISKVEPGCAEIGGPEGMASYKTTLARGRYCLPANEDYPELRRKIIDMYLAGRADNLMETLASVPQAMHILSVAFFVSLLLGYAYLGLLRRCSEVLLRLSLLLTITGLFLLGWRFWIDSSSLPNQGTSSSIAVLGYKGARGEASLMKVGASMAWVACAGLACMAVNLRAKTVNAAACVEVTCEAMLEMKCSLLLLPAARALCEAILAPTMLHGLLLLLSCVEGSFIPVLGVHMPEGLIIFFYTLVCMWCLGLMHALYQFVVAYALAEYYYTPYDHDDEKDVGCCTVWDGLTIGLLCHSGSLALGSLLITLLMPLAWLAHCSQFAWRGALASGNGVVACLCCCCARAARCWRGTLGFVNKNSYIDMVITSHSFCASAQHASQLLASLGGSVAALNGATDLLAVLGSANIIMATTYVVSARGALVDEASSFRVNDPVATMVVSAWIALRVTKCFMSLLDVASDTLLYCYGIDLQSGKGSQTAPEALKQVVHAHEED